MEDLFKCLKSYSKQILIFDFDETIAQIVIDWLAWHKGVADIITKFNPDHEYTPRKEHLYINESIRQFGKPLRDLLWEFNEAYEVTNAEGMQINVPLVELIKSDRRFRKFLFTSNSKAVVIPYLSQLNIGNCFERFCFRDDVELIKPDPDGFWRILYDESVPLIDYLMIGDSSSDEGMAKAADIDFFKIEM